MSKETNEIIQSIFGIYKLKYSMIDETYSNNNIKYPDNIHINCDSILDNFYKLFEKRYEYNNEKLSISIASSLLNLAGHYKHYFLKRKKNIKIYFYFYKNFEKSTNLSEELNEVKNLMLVISKYLPNIFTVIAVTQNIAVTTKYFFKSDINLVISRSIIDMLLVDEKNYGFRIRNKNNVHCYNSENFYSEYLKIDMDKCKNIPIQFSSIIMSYCGYKKYEKVKGIGSHGLIKTIKNALDEKIIVPFKYPDIKDFIDDMHNGKLLTSIDSTNAINNFKIFDIDYNYNKLIAFSSATKMILDNYIITKFAKNELKKLNTTYFHDENNINFDFLLEEYRSPKEW